MRHEDSQGSSNEESGSYPWPTESSEFEGSQGQSSDTEIDVQVESNDESSDNASNTRRREHYRYRSGGKGDFHESEEEFSSSEESVRESLGTQGTRATHGTRETRGTYGTRETQETRGYFQECQLGFEPFDEGSESVSEDTISDVGDEPKVYVEDDDDDCDDDDDEDSAPSKGRGRGRGRGRTCGRRYNEGYYEFKHRD